MKRHLTPEEQAERQSMNTAFARYRAEPDRYAIPEKGTDNRWHLNPCAPPPLSPSGFAPPFREEIAEPETPQEPRMSMADYQAMRSQSHAPPSPGSAAKAAKLHEVDKPRIDAKAKKAADKRKIEAAKKAEAERLSQAQGSLL